mmetsp:Transcript_925/g.2469  ORF Transcript_925/g.2469 Transcript_925/m.2469 type:complete len:164 (-) Transcript_925:329-820(-)
MPLILQACAEPPARCDPFARRRCAEGGIAECRAELNAVSNVAPPLGGLVVGGGSVVPRALTSLEPRWERDDVQPAVDRLSSKHGGLKIDSNTLVLRIVDLDAHGASLTIALAASASSALVVAALGACFAYWWLFPCLADWFYEVEDAASADACLGVPSHGAED